MQKDSQRVQRSYRSFAWMRRWLPIIFNGLIVVVVAVQAYIYKRQSDLMSVAIHESVETRELENRPWVNAESAELMQPMELPPRPLSLYLRVTMKNFGTAAALDAMPYIHALPNSRVILSRSSNKACDRVEEQRKTVEEKDPHNPWPAFALAPGQVTKLELATFSQEITAEQARAGDFYVLGCVTYKGLFRKLYRTSFCFKPTSKVEDPAYIVFEICNRFQKAD